MMNNWHFSECPIMWVVGIVGSDAGSLEEEGIVLGSHGVWKTEDLS